MSNGVRVLIETAETVNSMFFNDPSDALDYLISEGVSKSVAVKSKPDIGWSWNDLPLTIPWNGTKYTLDSIQSNLAKPKKIKKELNCPEMVVRTRFNHVIESLDGKHGTGYASKNPNLVMHLMDQIKDERYIQNEF